MLVTIGVERSDGTRLAGSWPLVSFGATEVEAAFAAAARGEVEGVVLGPAVRAPLSLAWALAAELAAPPVLVLAAPHEADRLALALEATPLPHRIVGVRVAVDEPWAGGGPRQGAPPVLDAWSMFAGDSFGCAFVDAQDRVLAWNAAAAELTGVDERAALGEPLDAVAGAAVRTEEVPVERARGLRRVRLRPAEPGPVPGMDPYRAAFERMGLGMVLLHRIEDGSFRVRSANAAVARLVGRGLEPGARLEDACPSLMRAAAPDRLRAVLDGGADADLGVVEIRPGVAPVPNPRWIGLRALALGGEELALTLDDLTTQRSAAAAVREHERFVESIIEHLPSMLFVKDARELRFVRFNRAGEELLGYDRADLLGRNDYDFFPASEADFFTAKDREVLRSGQRLDIPEEPIHTRARGVRWLHTQKIPLYDAEGRPTFLLGISQDITETREAREQLARQAAELARSNAELEQFAYVASHDLQEPLRKIQAFGDRLVSIAGDRLPPEGLDHLRRMQRAAARMQLLVDDLLGLSRVSSRPLRREPVPLDDALGEALANLDGRMRETGARIEAGPLPTVLGDPVQLVQLFQNLVGNAVKYRRPGTPPVVRVRCRAVGDRSLPRWRVEVEDEGIGFEPRYADQIFQPFARLHGREAYEGTGLGLTICRRIVERHGGTIVAEGRPGAGATFVVELPAHPVPEASR